MPIRLVALPLSAEDLQQLAAENYALMDQAVRTPGLLIAQAPDVPASNGHLPLSDDDAVAVKRAQVTPP